MIGALDSINDLLVPNSNKGHGYPNTDYLRVYDKYFNEYRDKECTVVELGIYQGSSIALWGRYFSKARIYGIDKYPENLVVPHYKEMLSNQRIRLLTGDYLSEPFISDLMKEIGPIDILIDDGDHHVDIQCKAVDYFKNHLSPDGIYCMEDVAYMKESTIKEGLHGADGFEYYIKNNTNLEIIEHHCKGLLDHLFIMKKKKQ